jgi:hypothetical protein
VSEDFFYETYVATIPSGTQYKINISYELKKDLQNMHGINFLEELKIYIRDELKSTSYPSLLQKL